MGGPGRVTFGDPTLLLSHRATHLRPLAAVDAPEKIDKLGADISSLTLEEAKILVDYLQDKLGVSAAAFAPAAVAAAPFAAASPTGCVNVTSGTAEKFPGGGHPDGIKQAYGFTITITNSNNNDSSHNNNIGIYNIRGRSRWEIMIRLVRLRLDRQ